MVLLVAQAAVQAAGTEVAVQVEEMVAVAPSSALPAAVEPGFENNDQLQ